MPSKNYTGKAVAHDMTLRERLDFYSEAHPSGCRLWQGTFRDGYGRLRYRRDKRNAHVWAWIDEHGPIPDGLSVLHRCDVRACIELTCLFLGTNAENVADKVAKGRQSRGAAHSATIKNKVSAEIEAKILAWPNRHRQANTAAKVIGVSRQVVRRLWKLP